MSSINRVSHLNRTYYTNKLKSSLTAYEYPDSPPLEIQYEVIKKNDGDSFKIINYGLIYIVIILTNLMIFMVHILIE